MSQMRPKMASRGGAWLRKVEGACAGVYMRGRLKIEINLDER
jgi:hypothetical protein